ncbi:hypothetical protein BCR43DRAFT_524586 [Syncephalastrum racemosum]|uniref:Uncharacterized protein n=1 Tax=Syncephalastrum racemosum TaxID=13706 RepID=A0A1X2HCI1_SYNRA|nr:hypothetical protein BCR43DRAFT_524586 [Syncephalastrum racemosum]
MSQSQPFYQVASSRTRPGKVLSRACQREWFRHPYLQRRRRVLPSFNAFWGEFRNNHGLTSESVILINSLAPKSLRLGRLQESDNAPELTKTGVIDFLKRVATTHRPSDWDNYKQVCATAEELFAIVVEHLPGASQRSPPPKQLYVLKDQLLDHAKHELFNHAAYRESVRQQHEWITVGYARKSKTNDVAESRCKCLQRMVNTLHLKDLCQHVFVSAYSDATSELRTRDVTLAPPHKAAISELRHVAGDFQDFLVLAKTVLRPIRLVVLDYRGLMTNVQDLQVLVRKYDWIKEICVDEGHHMNMLRRDSFIKGTAAKRSQAAKGPVRLPLI